MALYAYQAFSKEGKRVQGTVDAGSVQGAREQVSKMGLYPISVAVATSETGAFGGILKRFFGPRVSLRDKIFFTKQLAVLLKAGVPLLESLELLIEQTEGGLRSIIIPLKDGIKEGQSLAEGLSRYPAIFDTTYVQLVRAGEASGNLEKILDRLSLYLERSESLHKKIRSAMMLPLIQLAVVGVVVVILLTYVVPEIAKTFSGEGVELPVSTQILISLSDFVVNYFFIMLGLLVALVALFFWWKSTNAGARAWDNFILHVPIIGYFARMGAVVQFSRTLGMLVEGGVNLAESLGIVCRVIDNRILVDALNAARENIIKQGRIAEYLKQTKLFPPVAIYLIGTGEKSGQLDAMLLTIADYYDTQVQDYADSLSGKLGPAMLLIMGVVVGFMVIAIGTPIMQMGDLAGAGYLEGI